MRRGAGDSSTSCGPAGLSGSTVERQEGSRAILSRAVANDGDNLPGGGVLRLSPRTPDAYAAIAQYELRRGRQDASQDNPHHNPIIK